MTPDINIPPEALKAASTVIFKMREDGDFSAADIARAAAEALLAAWPKMLEQQFYELTPDGNRITFPAIILPLPQEVSDE